LFRCPQCGEHLEEQSKAEEGFNTFPSNKVPIKTAIDVLGGVIWCFKCNQGFKITRVDDPDTMELVLVSQFSL
jgi:uncharacterized protein YbaR (Trm112 family)